MASPSRSNGIASPSHDMASPSHNMASPSRSNGIASPSHDMASPSHSMASPSRSNGIASPYHDMASPAHSMASPSRSNGIASPYHSMASPSHGMEPPSQGMESPSHAMASSMAMSSNPDTLSGFDMSTLYFKFYAFEPEDVYTIACVMQDVDSVSNWDIVSDPEVLMATAMSYVEKKLGVTWQDASFGHYLARTQTDLIQLDNAIRIEHLSRDVRACVQRLKDVHGKPLDKHHPARVENSKVWAAAVAQVIENFAALRVPVDEQLVLYNDFHGLKLEAIHTILVMKHLRSSEWDADSEKDLEDFIASAKETFIGVGGKLADAESLGEYLARGQAGSFDDLNLATFLSSEMRDSIAHLDMVDRDHQAFPNNSEVSNAAIRFIMDNNDSHVAASAGWDRGI